MTTRERTQASSTSGWASPSEPRGVFTAGSAGTSRKPAEDSFAARVAGCHCRAAGRPGELARRRNPAGSARESSQRGPRRAVQGGIAPELHHGQAHPGAPCYWISRFDDGHGRVAHRAGIRYWSAIQPSGPWPAERSNSGPRPGARVRGLF